MVEICFKIIEVFPNGVRQIKSFAGDLTDPRMSACLTRVGKNSFRAGSKATAQVFVPRF